MRALEPAVGDGPGGRKSGAVGDGRKPLASGPVSAPAPCIGSDVMRVLLRSGEGLPPLVCLSTTSRDIRHFAGTEVVEMVRARLDWIARL